MEKHSTIIIVYKLFKQICKRSHDPLSEQVRGQGNKALVYIVMDVRMLL